MTLANAFTSSNVTTQTFPAWQAGIDSNTAALAAVAGQFQPTVDGATLKVTIGAGTIVTSTGLLTVASQFVTLGAAPASNSRIDLVVVDRISGLGAVVAGTAAVSPVAPTCPAGKLPVAQITVAAGTLALPNAMGQDVRTTWCPALGSLSFAAPSTDGSLRLVNNVLQANEPVTEISAAVSLSTATHFGNYVATTPIANQPLPAGSGLWNGYAVGFKARGGAITFTPSGTDAIDRGGAGTAWTMTAGTSGVLICDGATPTNWTVMFQGSAVTAADLANVQQDIIEIYLKEAIDTGAAAGSYVNGGFDAFGSDTLSGVSGTAGQTYDAVNKLYGNPGGFGANAAGSGTASADTSYGSTPPSNGIDGNAGSTWYANVAVGIFTVDFGGSPKVIGRYSILPVTGILTTAPKNWTFEGWNGSAWVVLDTQSGITTWSDNTYKTYDISNTASYAKYRVNITLDNGNGNVGFNELQLFPRLTPPNMTLVTAALSPAPSAAPTQAQIDLLWKDQSGAAVLGNDLTVEVTSNGGSNWYIATPIDTGITVSGFKLLKTVITLPGSGTAVQIRVKVLNNKWQQARGLGLMVK
jgi:hypothetical protein